MCLKNFQLCGIHMYVYVCVLVCLCIHHCHIMKQRMYSYLLCSAGILCHIKLLCILSLSCICVYLVSYIYMSVTWCSLYKYIASLLMLVICTIEYIYILSNAHTCMHVHTYVCIYKCNTYVYVCMYDTTMFNCTADYSVLLKYSLCC